MYRTTGRAALRASNTVIYSSLAPARTAGRRYLTTAPPHKTSRNWKNSALRWGLAGAGIYYYNTSPVFAEAPQSNLLNPNLDALDDNRDHPTIDQITASSRNKTYKDKSTLQSVVESASEDLAAQEALKPQPPSSNDETISAPIAELEEEAGQEGAYNPVTGEINWDCPCLGGMAHGPCGEEFKTAFSCFVYSNEEPKGMDCVEKFQGMQDCFRAHPEVYKGELEDDDNAALDGELEQERQELKREIEERREQLEQKQSQRQRNLLDVEGGEEDADASSAVGNTVRATSEEKTTSLKKTTPSPKKETTEKPQLPAKSVDSPQPDAKTKSHTLDGYSAKQEVEKGADSPTIPQRKAPETSADAVPESGELVPKAWHDARGTEIEGGRMSKNKST